MYDRITVFHSSSFPSFPFFFFFFVFFSGSCVRLCLFSVDPHTCRFVFLSSSPLLHLSSVSVFCRILFLSVLYRGIHSLPLVSLDFHVPDCLLLDFLTLFRSAFFSLYRLLLVYFLSTFCAVFPLYLWSSLSAELLQMIEFVIVFCCEIYMVIILGSCTCFLYVVFVS